MPGERNILSGFRVLETPNPTEMCFAVDIPTDLIRPSMIPAILTPYNRVPPGFPKERSSDGWGEYVFTGIMTHVRAPQGFTAFGFAAPKTAEQAATPFRDPPQSWMGSKTWPDRLDDVGLEPDPVARHGFNITNGTENGILYLPVYTCHPKRRNGPKENTRFVLREFIGNTPFAISQQEAPNPQPLDIHVLGLERTLPEFLHKRLVVGRKSFSASALYPVAGPTSVTISSDGQVFEATNFEDLEEYCDQQSQEQVNAVWYLKQRWAIPPEEDDSPQ